MSFVLNLLIYKLDNYCNNSLDAAFSPDFRWQSSTLLYVFTLAFHPNAHRCLRHLYGGSLITVPFFGLGIQHQCNQGRLWQKYIDGLFNMGIISNSAILLFGIISCPLSRTTLDGRTPVGSCPAGLRACFPMPAFDV